MCFLTLMIKGIRLQRKLNKYKLKKKIAMEGEEAAEQASKGFWARFCPKRLRGRKNWRGRKVHRVKRFWKSLTTYGTFENYVIKSVMGFLGGVCLTYVFFAFFILQLNFSFISATMICSIFGIVLTLGLAYSYKVRCVVLMLLPQLFSKRGRQALTAYAFILVLTGPAKNTLHNMRMLSESLACGQAKLKSAIKSVVDIIKEPLKAIRTSMEYIMKKVKEIVVKVKAMISSLKKAILAICVLKAGFDWLNSVVSICSKKMGTPYQRCSKVFDDAVIDCKAKLGPLFDWMCSATYMVKAVCYTVKVLDFICEVIEFVGDEVVMKVKKKFREFSYRLRNVFYVSIDFSHSFELKSNQSKSVREITAGIATEIRQRTSGLLYLFDWMSFVFSFFFLYIIFQTITYKRKFLTQEWYDNRFLTDDIVMLDMKRAYLGKETILPLNFHEKKKYISFTSWRLVSNERKRLAKTAIFLTVATIKLSIHMMTDYSLYWILNMIRYHGQFQSNLDAPSKVEVRVSGKGVVAELFSSIINAFQPAGIKNEFDTVPCLPDPRPPDIGRYKQIVSLVILTWILAVTEPYGLRLRNYVMCYYYPVAARQRAVWLYNHILRSRGSFLKFARRQLRRKFGKGVSYGVEMEKFSCMDRLRALCPSLERFFPGTKDKCLLCGTPATPNSPLIYCPTPGCQGKFCNNCYATMKNICTLCKTPVEYGDISDISEEKDSSEEDQKQEEGVERVSTKKKRVSFKDDNGLTKTESVETEALIEEEESTDTELSYEYQDKERRLNDRPSYVITHDVEEQKRIDSVNMASFEEPVDDFNVEEKEDMNLAERRRTSLVKSVSGFLFPTGIPDEMMGSQSEIDTERAKPRLRAASDPLLHKTEHIYRFEICDEYNGSSTSWSVQSPPRDLPQYSVTNEIYGTRRRKIASVDRKPTISKYEVESLQDRNKYAMRETVGSFKKLEKKSSQKSLMKVTKWLGSKEFHDYPRGNELQSAFNDMPVEVKVREYQQFQKHTKKFGILQNIKQFLLKIFTQRRNYNYVPEEDEEEDEEEEDTEVQKTEYDSEESSDEEDEEDDDEEEDLIRFKSESSSVEQSSAKRETNTRTTTSQSEETDQIYTVMTARTAADSTSDERTSTVQQRYQPNQRNQQQINQNQSAFRQSYQGADNFSWYERLYNVNYEQQQSAANIQRTRLPRRPTFITMQAKDTKRQQLFRLFK